MTIQQPTTTTATPVQRIDILPETAPFSGEQRAWLNGFFAGILSLEAQQSAAGGQGGAGAAAKSPDGDDGEAPWHDAAMVIDERMKLAEARPLRRRLFAAMAQQDCGQCGYQCETYADALAGGVESRQNLCVPGGKDTSRMLKRLLEDALAAPSGAAPAAAPAPAVPKVPPLPGYSREATVSAVFRGATPICGSGSEKDTRHVVFDISGSGIDYAPGDSFGLVAHNDPALVDAVLAAMRAPAEFPIEGPGGTKSFRDSLIEDYAVGLAPDMLFELMSYIVGGARRQKLKALAKGQDPDGDAATYDVLKVLETFGPVHPDPEAFLECLEPLQPRLYSISSSPLATPGELHLTVDAVRYDIDGRRRLGVASTYLADRLAAGAGVQVYVQKAHGFALPADPSTPIIMCGPGTGIAPFRSFLWHRQAQKAQGQSVGRSWLFFGHQREESDFFYRDELAGLAQDGVLTKLSTAWSRDKTPKTYVQDRMRAEGAELWSWLKAGAHFYVCGDAKRMARDVEKALAEVAAEHGHMSEAGGRDFIAEMKAASRYQADVY